MFNVVEAQLRFQVDRSSLSQTKSQAEAGLRDIRGKVTLDIDQRSLAQVGQLASSLKSVEASMRAATEAASRAAASFNSMSSAAGRVGSAGTGFSRVATSARQAAEATQAANYSMAEFGQQAALAGRRFAAFSVAAGAMYGLSRAIRGALGEAVAFDLQLNRLRQVSGDTAMEVGGIGKEVGRLASSLGASSAELMEAAVTIRSAGVSTKDTQASLAAIAKASLAPNFKDVKQTTEGAIAAMRQFGVTADQLEGKLGSLNAVAGDFAVEATDLVTVLQKAGATAVQAGVSFEELQAIFTAVRGTTRESADSIATGLRTIFSRLQRSDTVDAMEKLEIHLRTTRKEAEALGNVDLTDQFVGGFEAIKRLQEGVGKLRQTDPRYAAAVQALGGDRNVSRVIPLLQQQATMQQALNVAKAGAASLDTASIIRQDALATKMTKVREEFQKLVNEMVQTKGFKVLVDGLVHVAEAFNGLFSVIKPLVPLMAAVGTAAVLKGSVQFARGAYQQVVAPLGSGPRQRYARGDIVSGSGAGDSVDAKLTPGEFIIRKDSAQKIGYRALRHANEKGELPRGYAEGGPVGLTAENLGAFQRRSSIWHGNRDRGGDTLDYHGPDPDPSPRNNLLRRLAAARSGKVIDSSPSAVTGIDFGEPWQGLTPAGLTAMLKRMGYAEGGEVPDLLKIIRRAVRNNARAAPGTLPYDEAESRAGEYVTKLLNKNPKATAQEILKAASLGAKAGAQKERRDGINVAGIGGHDFSTAARIAQRDLDKDRPSDQGPLVGSGLPLSKLQHSGSQTNAEKAYRSREAAALTQLADRGLPPGTAAHEAEYARLMGGSGSSATAPAASLPDNLGGRTLATGLGIPRASPAVITSVHPPPPAAVEASKYTPFGSIPMGLAHPQFPPAGPEYGYQTGEPAVQPYSPWKGRDKAAFRREFAASQEAGLSRFEASRYAGESLTGPVPPPSNQDQAAAEFQTRRQMKSDYKAFDQSGGDPLATRSAARAAGVPLWQILRQEGKTQSGFAGRSAWALSGGPWPPQAMGYGLGAKLSDGLHGLAPEGEPRYPVGDPAVRPQSLQSPLGLVPMADAEFQEARRFSKTSGVSTGAIMESNRVVGRPRPDLPKYLMGDVLHRRGLAAEDAGSLEASRLRTQIAGKGGPDLLSRGKLEEMAAKNLAKLEGELAQGIERQLKALYPAITATESRRKAEEMAAEALASNASVLRTQSGQAAGLTSLETTLVGQGKSSGVGQTGVWNRIKGWGSRAKTGVMSSLRGDGNPMAAYAALAGAGLVGSQFDPSETTIKAAATGGAGSQFKAYGGSAISGMASMAAAGAGIGMLSSNPLGVVIGAAAGALVGLGSSIAETAKQINEARLGNALSNLTLSLETLVTHGAVSGTEEESLRDLGAARSAVGSKTRGWFGGVEPDAVRQETRAAFGGLAGKAASALNNEAERAAKRNPKGSPADIVESFNTGLNAELMRIVADVRGVPLAAVLKEYAETVAEAQKSLVSKVVQERGQQAAEQTALAMGRLADAANAAAAGTGHLDARLDILAGKGVSHDFLSRGLAQFGSARTGDFNAAVGGISSVLGGAGGQFAQTGSAASAVARELPAVLQTMASQGFDSKDGAGKRADDMLRERLGNDALASNPELPRLIAIVAGELNKMEGEHKPGEEGTLAKRLRTDASAVKDEAMRPASGPFLETAKVLAERLEGAAKKLADGLVTARHLADAAGEASDNAAKLRLDTSRAEAEFAADKTGRRAIDYLSLGQLKAPLQVQQERLTGASGLRGDAANDPAALGTSLKRVQDELLAAGEASRKNPADARLGERFEGLQSQANNLQQALKNVADAGNRTAAVIREKLNAANLNKDSRLSYAEKFYSSDPTEQSRMRRGQSLVGFVDRGKTEDDAARRFAGLSATNKRLFLESVNGLGQTVLGSNRTAEGLKRVALGGQPGVLAGKDEKNIQQLQAEFLDAMRKAADAEEERKKSFTRSQTTFIADLRSAHAVFLERLSAELSGEKLRTKQNELTTANVEVGKVAEQQRQATLLAGLGVTDDAGLQVARGKADLVKQYFAERRTAEAAPKAAAGIDALSDDDQGVRKSLARDPFDLAGAAGASKALSGFEVGERARIASGVSGLDVRNETAKVHEERGYAWADRRNNRLVKSDGSTVEGEGAGALIDDARAAAVNRVAKRLAQQNLVSQYDKATARQAELSGKLGPLAPGIAATPAGEAEKKLLDAITNGFKDSGQSLGSLATRATEAGKKVADLTGEIAAMTEAAKATHEAIAALKRPPAAAGGEVPAVPGMASGGGVFSPRGSDTVPAMLTPGEFVVNARSARANLGLLRSLNAARGVAHLADGGGVGFDDDSDTPPRPDLVPPPPPAQPDPAVKPQPPSYLDNGPFGPKPSTAGGGAHVDDGTNEQWKKSYPPGTTQEEVNADKDRGWYDGREKSYVGTGLAGAGRPRVNGREQDENSTFDDTNPSLTRRKRRPMPFGFSSRSEAFGFGFSRHKLSAKEKIARGFLANQAANQRSFILGQALARSGGDAAAEGAVAQRSADRDRIYKENRGETAFGLYARASGDRFNLREIARAKKKAKPFAAGGFVPGSGATDTVPAMLTPGEFVLNKRAAAAAGMGRLSLLNHFANGGLVGGAASPAGVSSPQGGSLALDPAALAAMQAFNGGAEKLGASLSSFNSGATSLVQSMATFNSGVDKLAGVVEKFPHEVTHTFNGTLNVNLNGVDVLAKLSDSLRDMVQEQVASEVSQQFKSRIPDAPSAQRSDPSKVS